MTNIERRHNQRINFEAPAKLIADGKEWKCTVIDVSLRGVLLKMPENWHDSPSEKQKLEVPLGYAEDGVTIKMEVAVVHIELNSAGFSCEYIDIESIGHLRRLMEFNLGDPELIYREIAELGTKKT